MGAETHSGGQRSARGRIGRIAAGLIALWAAASLAHASDPHQDRRNRVGQRLLRTMLAAVEDLASRTSRDGDLLVVFYYTDDRDQAIEQAQGFAQSRPSGEPEPIRGLPLVLDVTDDPEFSPWTQRTPDAIFLTQSPDEATLARILRYGIERQVLVFSPFEGHVERGALGGISVEAQVLPYVNTEAMAASGVRLKDFFLKVAKLYP